MRKWISAIIPKGFLWRLTFVNFMVITVAILLSGWAIYETACFLVDGIGNYSAARQNRFNATLFQYVFLFTGLAVTISSAVHFYLTKKLIHPIRELTERTKLLKEGKYSKSIQVKSNDEISELIKHYNELVEQLQKKEEERKKIVEDLSHELRTPVANLKGYLFALQSGDMQGNQEIYHSLYHQTEQLAKLIEQMERLNEWENITSRKYVEKEKVSIRTIILHATHMFSWKLEQSKIKLECTIEEDELFIHVEGIQQVITNLLDNAIQYYQGDGPIEVVGENGDDGYYVSVTSPGETISDEDTLRIFDRFYRIDSSRNRASGGSGLGLAIAKEIMENHEGTVDVQSNNGENTFIFYLPK